MRDVYIYEIPHGQMRQLTRTGITWESEWRPDGRRIAMLSGAPAGQWSLFWAHTDFSGTPELLFRSSHAVPANWLPDGRSLLFYELVEHGIWKLSPDGDGEPQLVISTEARERFPSLSPDGEWIAYVADESGRREVFVQSFPDLGPKHKISIDGGGEPLWSPDGLQLFFREGGQMLVVDVDYEPAFHASRPRVLFTGDHDAAASGHQHYDISLDGEKFLMIRHGDPIGPSEVDVVLNWSGELKGP
jgi:Tol biopolymer transport system component